MTVRLYTIPLFLGIVALLLTLPCACNPDYTSGQDRDLSCYIPFLKDIVIDGETKDWPDNYVPVRIFSDIYGNIPEPSDMKACFRLAWNEKGLLILAEVEDDSIFEDPARSWNGDGMELFISPSRGSFDIIQISLRPSYDLPDSLVALNIYDHRRTDSLKAIVPASIFCSRKNAGEYKLEGLIPLDMIGIDKPDAGEEISVQLYLNDSDRKNDSTNFSLPWFPVRDSYRNPWAFQTIRFQESESLISHPEIRAYIEDEDILYLKILSDQSYALEELGVYSGKFSARFRLIQNNIDIYTYEWKLPVEKYFDENDIIDFFRQDSLLLSLDFCLIHKSYNKIPEPNRFEKEIRIFEIMDHFISPPSEPVLFTGSSTIRKWIYLDKDFPGLKIINRGFGGSTMEDLNFYRDRIVFPYNPSSIYIYEGDNDIARGASPSKFITDCLDFIHACKENIPGTEIYFLSIKPSPSRMRYWTKMQEANKLLRDLALEYENVHYIDISPGMLNDEGIPSNELYQNDRLHLNKEGYNILKNNLIPFISH